MPAYILDSKGHVKEILAKLERKNPRQLSIIRNKLKQVLENPHRFKPLRGDMKGLYRVHIDKSFVLVYSVDEQRKTVVLEDYDHHDSIYK